MDSFPFTILFNFKMDTFNIKPPSNFTCLTEVAIEKYDLKVVHFFYTEDNGHSKQIKNDLDYAGFLIDSSEAGAKEVEVLVKDEEDISNKQRKKSMRKRSLIKASDCASAKGRSDLGEDEGLNDMMNDYDLFGDTRNRKAMMSEGQWSNQCVGYMENRRINYIKEKKDKQREDQRKAMCMGIVKGNDEETRSNKRRLKCNERDNDDDDEDMKSEVSRGDKKKGKKNRKR